MVTIVIIVLYWRNKKNSDLKFNICIKYIKEQYPKLEKILLFSFMISILIYLYLPISPDTSKNNIETLFEVSSKGISILGAFIVAFSVATINSTSNNYSTRLLDLFMNKSFFKAYLFLIILSLGIGSIVGAFIPPNNVLDYFLVIGGLTLLVSNFIALFVYIDEIIKFMKPEYIGKNVLDEIKFEDTKNYISKITLGRFGKDENHFSKYPLQYLDVVFRKTVDSEDRQVFKYLLEETHKKFQNFENTLYTEYLKVNDLQTYIKIPVYFGIFYKDIILTSVIEQKEEYWHDTIKNINLILNNTLKREIDWCIGEGRHIRDFLNDYTYILDNINDKSYSDIQKLTLLQMYEKLIFIGISALNSPYFRDTKFGQHISLELSLIMNSVIEMKMGDICFVSWLHTISYLEYNLMNVKILELDPSFSILNHYSIYNIIKTKCETDFDVDWGVIRESVTYFLIDYLFTEKDFSENLGYLLKLYDFEVNTLKYSNSWLLFELDQIRNTKFLNIEINSKKVRLTPEQYDKFSKLYNEFQKKTQNGVLDKGNEEADVFSINDQNYSSQLK